MSRKSDYSKYRMLTNFHMNLGSPYIDYHTRLSCACSSICGVAADTGIEGTEIPDGRDDPLASMFNSLDLLNTSNSIHFSFIRSTVTSLEGANASRSLLVSPLDSLPLSSRQVSSAYNAWTLIQLNPTVSRRQELVIFLNINWTNSSGQA